LQLPGMLGGQFARVCKQQHGAHQSCATIHIRALSSAHRGQDLGGVKGGRVHCPQPSPVLAMLPDGVRWDLPRRRL
jgi:hypothetical protein